MLGILRHRGTVRGLPRVLVLLEARTTQQICHMKRRGFKFYGSKYWTGMVGTVFWNVTSYSLVDMNRCLGETFSIHCILHTFLATILHVQYLIPTCYKKCHLANYCNDMFRPQFMADSEWIRRTASFIVFVEVHTGFWLGDLRERDHL